MIIGLILWWYPRTMILSFFHNLRIEKGYGIYVVLISVFFTLFIVDSREPLSVLLVGLSEKQETGLGITITLFHVVQ